MRVLLADESPAIKKVFQLALQDYAAEVRSVSTGFDVEPVIKQFSPDIVFADVLLQKKSGYDVSASLKSSSEFRSIPVVLMCSGFMEVDEDKFEVSSANARLEKPFDINTLRSTIKDLVPKTKTQTLSDYLDFPDLSEIAEDTKIHNTLSKGKEFLKSLITKSQPEPSKKSEKKKPSEGELSYHRNSEISPPKEGPSNMAKGPGGIGDNVLNMQEAEDGGEFQDSLYGSVDLFDSTDGIEKVETNIISLDEEQEISEFEEQEISEFKEIPLNTFKDSDLDNPLEVSLIEEVTRIREGALPVEEAEKEFGEIRLESSSLMDLEYSKTIPLEEEALEEEAFSEVRLESSSIDLEIPEVLPVEENEEEEENEEDEEEEVKHSEESFEDGDISETGTLLLSQVEYEETAWVRKDLNEFKDEGTMPAPPPVPGSNKGVQEIEDGFIIEKEVPTLPFDNLHKFKVDVNPDPDSDEEGEDLPIAYIVPEPRSGAQKEEKGKGSDSLKESLEDYQPVRDEYSRETEYQTVGGLDHHIEKREEKKKEPSSAGTSSHINKAGLERIIHAQLEKIIESMVQKIVPDLATKMIEQEIRRLFDKYEED